MRLICLDETKDAPNLPFAMLLFPCGFGGCGGRRGPASAMLVIYVVERVDVDDPAYTVLSELASDDQLSIAAWDDRRNQVGGDSFESTVPSLQRHRRPGAYGVQGEASPKPLNLDRLLVQVLSGQARVGDADAALENCAQGHVGLWQAPRRAHLRGPAGLHGLRRHMDLGGGSLEVRELVV